MFKVIFIDTRGPATLGTYEDKGACRRAWKMLNAGAAIVDSSGAVLEYRGGVTDAAKRKLEGYAEHLRRQAALAPASARPVAPARAKVVEPEEDDEQEPEEPSDDEEEEVDEEPALAPRLPPTVKPVPVAAPPTPAPVLKVGDVVTFPASGPLGRCFAVVRALVGIGALVEFDNLGQPWAVDRDSITRDGEGWVCSTPFPDPPAAEHARAAEAFRAVGELARAAEVTHAHHPTTGEVVQGDDTERLTPATTCARKGCKSAPGLVRSNVRPEWLPFCGADRAAIRERSRSMEGGEAAVIAHMKAGTLPPALRRGPVAKKAPAPKRTAKPVAHREAKPAPVPKPTRASSPASTLATALARVKRCAAVVDALGGVEAAEKLAELVRESGGVAEVAEALTELRRVA